MIRAVMIKGKPDDNYKACFDCDHCQAAVSWWCVNKDAAKHRGTKIPGASHCKFWKPVRTIDQLSKLEKLFTDFIEIENKD